MFENLFLQKSLFSLKNFESLGIMATKKIENVRVSTINSVEDTEKASLEDWFIHRK